MNAVPGRCFRCGASLPQQAMQTHLTTCRPQEQGAPLLLLFVQDSHFPETYWMFLEADQHAPLAALDDFLRRVWVDCCGHYSQFVIAGETYGRRPNPSPVDVVLDERAHRMTMDKPMAALLHVGQTADYTYDETWFTELKVHVVAAYNGQPPAEGVRVIARNYKPPRACRVCQRQAEWLFTNAWPLEPYCTDHAQQHPAWGKPDAFLPYINSPRVGVCTYRGPVEDALRFEILPPE